MDFANRIRMSNLFSGAGRSKLKPADDGNDIDYFTQLLNSTLGPIEQGRRNEFNREKELRGLNDVSNGLRGQQPVRPEMMSNGMTPKPMDTVLGPSENRKPRLSLEQAEAARYDPQFNNYQEPDSADKFKLQADNKSREIAAQQARELALEAARGGNRILTEKEKGGQARETEGVKVEGRQNVATTTGGQNRLTEVTKGEQARQTENIKGAQVMMVPDPNNPGKMISTIVKPDATATGVKMDGQQVGPTTKPGTPNQGFSGSTSAEARQKVKNMAAETLVALDELRDEGGKLKSDVGTAVGTSRWLDPRNYLPGTSAQTGKRKMETFLSKQVLNTIAEMKAQSKTGATGFGALNMKELGVLEKAANSIDMNMPDEDIEKELVKISDRLQMILQDEASSGDGVIKKTQRNPRTGETREVISTDGGKTWQTQ